MTIAQQIKWDFEANGSLEIKNKNGNRIYIEDSNGFWKKYEHDSQGNQIYFENSKGYWVKMEYDSQGNEIYSENSGGFWTKWEYDSQGNQIYFENSYGIIEDKRLKSYENKIIEIEGIKYKLTKL